MNASLLRLFFIAFVAVEVVLAVGAVWLCRGQLARVEDALGGQRPVVAERILDVARDYNRRVARIARHPLTSACFRGGGDACATLMASLRTTLTDADVRLVTADGVLVTGATAGGLPSTDVSGKGGIAEAHLALTVTHPVNGSETIGHVVLTQAAPELQSLLDSIPLPDGYVELRQTEAYGRSRVVLRHGDEDLANSTPTRVYDLAGTPWKLAVWPNALGVGLRYLGGWLALSVLVASILGVLYFRLRQAIHADLKLVSRVVEGIAQQRIQEGPEPQLSEFRQALSTIVRAGQAVVGTHKAVAEAASVDHLSQVYNRRSFEAKQRELFQTLKSGSKHSLLITDIDNFKQVNDSFGHDAGDQLIVQFGKALKDHLRGSDFVARLGGDEFCVIFTNTPLERGRELAERLRAGMPEVVELAPGVLHRLRWTGGLSEYSLSDASENQALARADSALLDAKREGRNLTNVKAAA